MGKVRMYVPKEGYTITVSVGRSPWSMFACLSTGRCTCRRGHPSSVLECSEGV